MKYCANCGTPMEEMDAVCPNCGTINPHYAGKKKSRRPPPILQRTTRPPNSSSNDYSVSGFVYGIRLFSLCRTYNQSRPII